MCRKIRYLLGSIGLLGIIIVGCNHAESNEQNTISSGYVEENSSEISTSIAEEEDNIIKEYYPKIGIKCLDMLNNKTLSALYNRARILGVKRM